MGKSGSGYEKGQISNGYFRVDNCDRSFCGDDIFNVHDDMFYIESIDSSRKVLKGTVAIKIVEPGHTIGFKDLQRNEQDYEATVASIERNGYAATITLSEPLPDSITTDMLAYSKTRASENYVLTSNYVHETKGGGDVITIESLLNGEPLDTPVRVMFPMPCCCKNDCSLCRKHRLQTENPVIFPEMTA